MTRWQQTIADGRASWLEVTNRPDLGANLKAPQTDDTGRDYWSYSLITQASHGDVVFHYHKPAKAIVATSRVVGTAWPDIIVWGARGTSARHAHRLPHERPGWCLALEDFEMLSRPLTLSRIRENEGEIRRIRNELSTSSTGAYFPFAISEKRPLRPSQGYLMRWPDRLNTVFPDLLGDFGAPRVSDALLFGADYRNSDEEAAVSRREPFEVDPAHVERGIRGHAVTQNLLASAVLALGAEPRSPRAGEPNYDLAWRLGHTVYVAEVKSLTPLNEHRQLRLGLGQVLHYAHVLSGSLNAVVPILALERAPSDLTWDMLCRRCGVLLIWPDRFEDLPRE